MAPWSIHARTKATCSGVSRFPSPSGGMVNSGSMPETAMTSRLFSLLPGTIALPLSPPARAATLLCKFRPDSCNSIPWQLVQRVRSGWMSFAKSTSRSAGGGSLAEAALPSDFSSPPIETRESARPKSRTIAGSERAKRDALRNDMTANAAWNRQADTGGRPVTIIAIFRPSTWAYIRSTASIPSKFRPCLMTRAVTSQSTRRLRCRTGVSALSTGHCS